MFERFTEASRRTLFFARLEASDTGSSVITTETLLLGLLREPKGIIATLFTTAGVTLGDVRQEVLKRQPAGDKIPHSVEIPFAAETKRALIYASEEADRLGQGYIGTEHLLLGLLREGGTIAASILEANALTLGKVRHAVQQAQGQPVESASESSTTEIDQIKRMVEDLGRQSDDFRRSLLVDEINERLDALKGRL